MIKICRPTPILKTHIKGVAMETMHLHIDHTKCFEVNFVSHLEGPTEPFGMDLKGPRRAG